jgi:hypothetical protein
MNQEPIQSQNASDDTPTQLPPDSADRPKVELTRSEWVLVFTMFVLLAQTIIYYETWKSVEKTVVATKDSTELTRQSFERAHRPWLSLDSDLAPQPISVINGQRRMNVVFSVKNAGASPAIGTVISSEFEYFDKPPNAVDRPCRRKTLEGIFQGKFGDLIIPQTSRTIQRTIDVPAEDRGKTLYLTGCIGYSDERFRDAKPTCLPYATSFVWRYSTKPEDCHGGAQCFVYGGFGLPQNMEEPKECDNPN